jgi:DNA-directed RNA polymerase specialized sigma24 family protein
MGNSAAASVAIDIRDALKYSNMTDKQEQCIHLSLIEGYTYAEICEMFEYKSKTAVTDFINGGIKKMIKYLND